MSRFVLLCGERKKARYVYYRCTHNKGGCSEPYVREEALDEAFTRELRALTFDPEVVDWVTDALRESYADERKFHDEAIRRLDAESKRIQGRLDTMYIDKLDGRISSEYFDRKATEWREERDQIREGIASHDAANESYMDTGLEILELAQRAPELFLAQDGAEKRRLLGFLYSNCSGADGKLTTKLRQPFDQIALAASAPKRETALAGAAEGRLDERLPRQDSVGLPAAKPVGTRRRPSCRETNEKPASAGFWLVTPSGLEPEMTGPKPVVLPITPRGSRRAGR